MVNSGNKFEKMPPSEKRSRKDPAALPGEPTKHPDSSTTVSARSFAVLDGGDTVLEPEATLKEANRAKRRQRQIRFETGVFLPTNAAGTRLKHAENRQVTQLLFSPLQIKLRAVLCVACSAISGSISIPLRIQAISRSENCARVEATAAQRQSVGGMKPVGIDTWKMSCDAE